MLETNTVNFFKYQTMLGDKIVPLWRTMTSFISFQVFARTNIL